ncbi:uncharacterized protein MONBRDRAFT_12303 [Monosiga brevicollis MX1]|uniref:Uncharacterized protein n=1 Tax=Monosiga brevicollis TaxID=81824 RepID=A9VBV2_MONBE|nr:uncharacterized protein MONBRDRAFT_12303 [Monosiga brevicollis MX1]EDQ85041.1 predicted protein [Monosiga brevicollis MX1]|eukprot:XP_001750211.1 hypothetical protein [Monosiga brevicollis MX1]
MADEVVADVVVGEEPESDSDSETVAQSVAVVAGEAPDSSEDEGLEEQTSAPPANNVLAGEAPDSDEDEDHAAPSTGSVLTGEAPDSDEDEVESGAALPGPVITGEEPESDSDVELSGAEASTPHADTNDNAALQAARGHTGASGTTSRSTGNDGRLNESEVSRTSFESVPCLLIA